MVEGARKYGRGGDTKAQLDEILEHTRLDDFLDSNVGEPSSDKCII